MTQVLPDLIERSLANGWRVVVRGGNPVHLDHLDEALWLAGGGESFLPHGRAGGAHDADQPVLLTTEATAPNGAACLMSVDGADVAPDEVAALDRVCVLFDGNDAAALEKARSQWRVLTKAGASAKYWSEESGRWEMKAEA